MSRPQPARWGWFETMFSKVSLLPVSAFESRIARFRNAASPLAARVRANPAQNEQGPWSDALKRLFPLTVC